MVALVTLELNFCPGDFFVFRVPGLGLEKELEVALVITAVLAGVGPVQGAGTGSELADPPE